MTKINIHGLLADEFGSSFKMDIGRPDLIFEAIDANRSGFKKRVLELHKEGFNYAILVDKKKIENKEDILIVKKAKTIDLVPVLNGAGGSEFLVAAIVTAVSTVAQILLAPKPPKPPEITQTANASKASFTFSNQVNRAAQGTPVPVGYGELIVGSEVIQSTIKSFPIGQETTASFRRNPFNQEEVPTESSTQFLT
jgi:predicted phage tail protein